ncbi:BadF/BadG/BcrA/BcrD ATPase family protein [Colwellia sp. 4_MG-2023]|uniref:N-acetylglucosamine kinase n=1 Tax=unclassified Colwellia TaxID=196834 RepID=UPI001C096149|nr:MULTISPECIES: BadF/BadG/BcrA/BcrD ATPase family protein [unclassified Colwellia]MBU2923654.1 hypothetical protein [Colwellia sp. C2M11]MDO6486221.1 BadF/BadG/BcrA/BcrD ATPase family protein [Colwellia sp. 6_MG-2023]MDO6505823.1 BadF/BadG/BcrA/BcrD ATPase family protein [Colwellia sp. 5_MG-2023]MDO6554504.1 BadF/BadG/BcrA/BcrD ATPase family protein [Colwellia sp. 4_MG-2023]MDO6652246.1 BadF/BadG/BcrA/BcrD ATPase family protein [Colwellia sp. 3_MG-2023]
MYYLGVDGGGTKTAFVLLDQQRNVVATHELGTCYHVEVGLEGAQSILQSGVLALLEQVSGSIDDIIFAFFGLPAYGEDSELINQIDALPSSFMSAEKYQCDNDMVNGWAAAFDCADGINIVAGTGSIAYGVNQTKTARCGGWGEVFSDEGSAYWVGRKGLQVFTKMSDGRLSKGPLYDILKSTLDFDYDLDITALVLCHWNSERSKIAAVSALVYQAASEGDQHAIAILAEAANELADIVEGTTKSLAFKDEDIIKVSYSGGIFNAGKFVLDPFVKALERLPNHYKVYEPLCSPVIGAALYAEKLSTL